METDETIILGIGVFIIIAKIASEVSSEFNRVKLEFVNFLLTRNGLIICAVVLFVVFIYLNYKLNYWIIKTNEKRRTRKEQFEQDLGEANKLLNSEIRYFNSNELRKHLNLLKESLRKIENDKDGDWLKEKIEENISEIELNLPVSIKKEKLDNLKRDESEIKENIRHLEYQKEHRLLELRELEETSLKKLRVDDNPVFIENDLTKKEKELLLKHDYKRAYEYCLDKQDFIHILVKPAMKHSVAHTFLVWSAMKMLTKINGISNVLDWDTRESDITFRYNNKKFALEIETGTLLKKKIQLRAKVDYLNEKYKDNWMIIVSKKNLVPKYSQFGRVSSRSDVPKKLKKMLKLVPSL